MKIICKPGYRLTEKTDAVVVPIFMDYKKPQGLLAEIDKKIKHRVDNLFKQKSITGKKHEFMTIYCIGEIATKSIVLLGLGTKKKYTYDSIRYAASELIRYLKKLGLSKVMIDTQGLFINNLMPAGIIQALVEGLIMGGYKFHKYKTKPDKEKLVNTVTFVNYPRKYVSKIKHAVKVGVQTANAVNIARDLENRSSDDLTPKVFVDYAKNELKNTKVKIEVIDKQKAEELGMNAFLGVAKGSDNEPYMLIMRYLPNKSERPVCLVGKGITFDAGGISLKPAKSMKDMKADMSGAAAVLAAMIAVAKIEPKRNIVAFTPLAENMPSGKAQKPGDIVKAYNGKTIEIVNTDAEGRLVLADALSYAVKENPTEIIDIATLTGASTVALGDHASAILGNNQKMINKMIKVSGFTGDKVWQLPLWEEYLEYLKSDIADISNCNEGRQAGTITAAKFLEQFVDKTPWIHLDIACQMDVKSTKGYRIKGMTGVGVRNILAYIGVRS
ncbi:leucyl aminopeptidase [Candidatus Margulisiibacteriota bacterium]